MLHVAGPREPGKGASWHWGAAAGDGAHQHLLKFRAAEDTVLLQELIPIAGHLPWEPSCCQLPKPAITSHLETPQVETRQGRAGQ